MLTLFVVSAFAFSVLALIPLTIMDGLSYEDSHREVLFSAELDHNTECELFFYEIEVNDATIGEQNIATKLGLSIGICSFNEEISDFLCNTSFLTAKNYANLIGGGVGVYLGSLSASRNISILGKEINIGVEVNFGLGVDFALGEATELGLCIGLGPALSIDWDP